MVHVLMRGGRGEGGREGGKEREEGRLMLIIKKRGGFQSLTGS